MHFVDGHDVRMTQLGAHLAFANKLLQHRRVFTESLPQHLHGHDFAAFGMHRAIDAGKRAGTHKVENLVVAVKETTFVAASQLVDLIVGQ